MLKAIKIARHFGGIVCWCPIISKWRFVYTIGNHASEQEIDSLLRAEHAYLIGTYKPFNASESSIRVSRYFWTCALLTSFSVLGTVDRSGRQIIIVPSYKGESIELSATLTYLSQLFRLVLCVFICVCGIRFHLWWSPWLTKSVIVDKGK